MIKYVKYLRNRGGGMAIKKNEIYSSLWASCDKLRGGMDASQYKDYILTLPSKPSTPRTWKGS